MYIYSVLGVRTNTLYAIQIANFDCSKFNVLIFFTCFNQNVYAPAFHVDCIQMCKCMYVHEGLITFFLSLEIHLLSGICFDIQLWLVSSAYKVRCKSILFQKLLMSPLFSRIMANLLFRPSDLVLR